MTGVSSGGGGSSGGGRMGRGLFTTPPSQLYYGGRGLNIHISTQYLHNIYTVSTQYLHNIYTVSSVAMTRQHWARSGHLAPGHQRLGPALTLAVRHETAPAGSGDTSISAVRAFLGWW